MRYKRIIAILTSLIILIASIFLAINLQKNDWVIAGGINRSLLFLLINIHLIIAITLLYFVIRETIKLFHERSKEEPGKVFKKNLFFVLTLFSVMPTIILSITGGKFITKSISAWFSNRISAAISSGLSLHALHTHGQQTKLCNEAASLKEQMLKNPFFSLNAYTQNSATSYTYYWLTDTQELFIKNFRQEIQLWRSYREHNDRSTEQLSLDFLQQLKKTTNGACFNFYGSLYCIHHINDHYLIVIDRYLPKIRNALINLQNSSSDYEQLKALKYNIYSLYGFLYIIITLLIILLSLWCAFYLARGISQPILELLQAMKEINKGNFTIRLTEKKTSDLRSLINGFNTMAQELQKAYESLSIKNKELFLIIKHINAAAFLTNQSGKILSHNDAALQFCTETIKFKRLTELNKQFHKPIKDLIRQLLTQKTESVQQEILFTQESQSRTLILTISILPQEKNTSTAHYNILFVIDDITELIKMNKLKTWQEAAKQMAHEIKNPLTPIQLATERLQKKYQTLNNHDSTFQDCTETILQQVALIKELSSHFSAFASLPALQITTINLPILIEEVAQIYRTSHPTILIQTNYEHMPLINSDGQSLKRILANLFDNSIRALLRKPYIDKLITINTYFDASTSKCTLIFHDNGPGINPSMQESIFLPYVSTEQKNMGLGLAIVQDSIKQLGGSIRLDKTKQGACFILEFIC
jgi:two-component system nitrogen regulation sensor histidine kinase NtrY